MEEGNILSRNCHLVGPLIVFASRLSPVMFSAQVLRALSCLVHAIPITTSVGYNII